MIKIDRIFFLFVFAILVYSCCKDNGPDVELDKLTKANWYYIKMRLIVINPIVPMYNKDSIIYPLDCEKKYYTRFLSDSTYINYYGKNKCDSYIPDSVVGKWSLNRSNFTLKKEDDLTGEGSYIINELNLKNLILVQETKIDIKVENKTETIRSKKTYYYENK
jgi:hypothetical protein